MKTLYNVKLYLNDIIEEEYKNVTILKALKIANRWQESNTKYRYFGDELKFAISPAGFAVKRCQ